MASERSIWFLGIICFLVFTFQYQVGSSSGDGVGELEAIYQLGDSLSDTGNFIRMNIPSSVTSGCTSLPYGETYFGFPMGRCSDGLLMTDFIARLLGLPFVNPYLETNADFRSGVDFAVYAATALSAAALEAMNLKPLVANASLSVQMAWFYSHLQSLSSSPAHLQSRLSRSLFIMGEIGGNDINFAFLEGKSFEFVYNLIPDVVEALKHVVQEVIDVGARYILVPSNFPIGCVPIYLGNFRSNDPSAYDDLKCLKAYNLVAKVQNDQIKKSISELQQKNPSVKIAYVDLYSAYTWLIANAASLGFEEDEVFNPCCGSKSNECGSGGAPLCTNPKNRISWDGTHPTHQANKFMVTGWILPILQNFTLTHALQIDAIARP